MLFFPLAMFTELTQQDFYHRRLKPDPLFQFPESTQGTLILRIYGVGPPKTGGLFQPCLLLPTTQRDILTFGATWTEVPASSLSRQITGGREKGFATCKHIFEHLNKKTPVLIQSILNCCIFVSFLLSFLISFLRMCNVFTLIQQLHNVNNYY